MCLHRGSRCSNLLVSMFAKVQNNGTQADLEEVVYDKTTVSDD